MIRSWFPEPTLGRSQPSLITPGPGSPMLSSGFHRHPHKQAQHIHVDIHIHTYPKKLKRILKSFFFKNIALILSLPFLKTFNCRAGEIA